MEYRVYRRWQDLPEAVGRCDALAGGGVSGEEAAGSGGNAPSVGQLRLELLTVQEGEARRAFSCCGICRIWSF